SQARLLELPPEVLIELPGEYALLETIVCVDLHHADREVLPIRCVIVVAVVFERLPERRRTVETDDAIAFVVPYEFCPRDPDRVASCLGGADDLDRTQASLDLACFQRHHPAECDVVVAEFL